MIEPSLAAVDQTGAIHHPHSDLLAGLRNGAWLDEQTFPPLRYAVPGLIPEGMTVLVGPPKAGKSWAALDICLAVASGGKALGAITVGRAKPVLNLALEDGDRRLQERCRALLGDEAIPPRFQYLTRVEAGRVLDTVRVWLDIQAGEAGQLVVLDTLGKVMPPAMPGESAYARDYRIGSALKKLADDYPGTALVVLHHDRKAGSEDFVDNVSGTHGIAGAADTIAVLARPRGEDEALFKVTGRDIREADYALTLDGGRWHLDGEDLDVASTRAKLKQQSEALGDRSADILGFVAEHPEGVRAAAVEEKFGGDARRYLARLVDSGRLIRPKRGVYATSVPSVPSVINAGQETTDLGHPTRLVSHSENPENLGQPVPSLSQTEHLADVHEFPGMGQRDRWDTNPTEDQEDQ